MIIKYKCDKCKFEYSIGEHALPECPQCIKSRMKHNGGLTQKHSIMPKPPMDEISFINSGIDICNVFKYIAASEHPNASGALLLESKQHNTYNALSYKPCGSILGSKIISGTPHAADYAMLVDLQEKSNTGPHFVFVTSLELDERINRGEWA